MSRSTQLHRHDPVAALAGAADVAREGRGPRTASRAMTFGSKIRALTLSALLLGATDARAAVTIDSATVTVHAITYDGTRKNSESQAFLQTGDNSVSASTSSTRTDEYNDKIVDINNVTTTFNSTSSEIISLSGKSSMTSEKPHPALVSYAQSSVIINFTLSENYIFKINYELQSADPDNMRKNILNKKNEDFISLLDSNGSTVFNATLKDGENRHPNIGGVTDMLTAGSYIFEIDSNLNDYEEMFVDKARVSNFYNDAYTFSFTPYLTGPVRPIPVTSAPVPESSVWLLMVFGMGGIGAVLRRAAVRPGKACRRAGDRAPGRFALAG